MAQQREGYCWKEPDQAALSQTEQQVSTGAFTHWFLLNIEGPVLVCRSNHQHQLPTGAERHVPHAVADRSESDMQTNSNGSQRVSPCIHFSYRALEGVFSFPWCFLLDTTRGGAPRWAGSSQPRHSPDKEGGIQRRRNEEKMQKRTKVVTSPAVIQFPGWNRACLESTIQTDQILSLSLIITITHVLRLPWYVQDIKYLQILNCKRHYRNQKDYRKWF